MTHTFDSHDDVRRYIAEHGLRATVSPGVFVRRCEGCGNPLHRDSPDGVVFHSVRLEGPAEDHIGRDRLRAWREVRA